MRDTATMDTQSIETKGEKDLKPHPSPAKGVSSMELDPLPVTLPRDKADPPDRASWLQTPFRTSRAGGTGRAARRH